MTKIALCFLAGITSLLAYGCNRNFYNGAIYADYTQNGIGVRMAPESSSPAEIHFAYDRGIFASIPKKKGAKDGQDSTAIISKNNVYTAKLSDDTKEIRVDAAFLTGMAAQVAGAPKGSKVNISVGKDGSIQDSPPIDITDTVAERINPLFIPNRSNPYSKVFTKRSGVEVMRIQFTNVPQISFQMTSSPSIKK